MIAKIRQYFKTQVLSVDSEMIEHNEPLLSDNIPQVNLQQSYQIIIGNLTSSQRDQARQDNFDVTVKIFGSGYRDQLNNYDELYCKALFIRDNIISLQNIDQSDLLDVSNTGIVVGSIDTDDNTYVFDLTFNVVTEYLR